MKNNNEEKRPRITIRYLDGDCVVEVHDKENLLILQQPVLDEDPYAFIARLRESLDGAQINEEPRLPLSDERKPHPYIRVIDNHIEEMKRMKAQLWLYFDALQTDRDEERSFTDNLS